MNQSVTDQELAEPEKEVAQEPADNKEFNFRQLEASRDNERKERMQERDARLRAEWEREQLKQQMEEIKKSSQPAEKDPFDEIEDLSEIDGPTLKQLLSHRDARQKQQLFAEFQSKLEEQQKRKARENYKENLRKRFPDYDAVMNEENLLKVMEQDAEAIEKFSQIDDPELRGELAYRFASRVLKAQSQTFGSQEEIPEKKTMQQRVDENIQNPYYLPSAQATPPKVLDFQVSSKSAREEAYQRLKAAQRGAR